MESIKLKKSKTSKKFGVVFPANVNLNYFTDSEKRMFAEHPNHSNIYIRVRPNECHDHKTKLEKDGKAIRGKA